MVKKLFLLVLLVMLLPLTSSVTYKLDKDVNLLHSIRFNGYPTSTAVCNITVYNTDGKPIVPFGPMVYDSSAQTYNYSISSSLTDTFGSYPYDITCTDNGENLTKSFEFEINRAGRDLGISESLIYILILVISVAFLGLMIFGSIKIPFKNQRNLEDKLMKVNFSKHLKLLMMSLSAVTFIWVTWLLYQISAGFIEPGANLFFLYLHKISLFSLMPLSVVLILYIVIIYIHDLQLDKKMKQGRYFNIDGIK